MAYAAAALEDVPITDMSEVESLPVDHDIRGIGEALGLQALRAHVWYFEPGEEIGYHAHAEQEELYYVVEGEFQLLLGPPDDRETRRVGPGHLWAAGPETGHGHRYVGDDRGVVLAIGAPPVEDVGRHPSEFE